MDANRFDRLTRALSEAGTRRGLLGLLATLPIMGGLLALLDQDETVARGRRHRRRVKRHKHGKGRRKHHKKKCKPKSKAKTCAGKCGPVKNKCKKTVDCGSCTCASNADCGEGFLCLEDGSCQACTVSCPSGDPATCGTALQTAMDAGGTIYVCPGTYQGGFTINKAVTVIGAGHGDNAASNTILDGNGAARVVQIATGTGTVEMAQLRITGGVAGGGGGAGIRHLGTTLRMTDCTVTGNTIGGGGGAGGIQSFAGTTLELTRCTVSDNHSGGVGGGINTQGTTTLTDCPIEGNDASFGGGIASIGLTTLAGSTEVRGNTADIGGGIYVLGGTLVIAATCRVTANTAPAGNGGGIFNQDGVNGTVTLQGADPSPIVVDNCHENCVGTVPKCAPGGTCPP
jgi:hypothetical protein